MKWFKRTWNVGNGVVLAGFVGLGLSFWLPVATARRAARVESWAEHIAARLLAAAVAEVPPLDVADPASPALLLDAIGPGPLAERLRALAPAEVGALAPGSYFEDRHYLFGVMRPADGGLEVYAWPRSLLGPGRTVFFFPEDAPAVYTHNLRARYAGTERAPRPRSGRPAASVEPADPDADADADAEERSAEDATAALAYRTPDDERWIELPPGRSP